MRRRGTHACGGTAAALKLRARVAVTKPGGGVNAEETTARARVGAAAAAAAAAATARTTAAAEVAPATIAPAAAAPAAAAPAAAGNRSPDCTHPSPCRWICSVAPLDKGSFRAKQFK
jgi:hypothetical protein